VPFQAVSGVFTPAPASTRTRLASLRTEPLAGLGQPQPHELRMRPQHPLERAEIAGIDRVDRLAEELVDALGAHFGHQSPEPVYLEKRPAGL